MTDGTRTGILGASGSGKSTVMNELIRPARHLVLFDYLPTRAETAGRDGIVKVRDLDDLKARMRANYASGFRLWYRPNVENQIEELHRVSLEIWNLQERLYEAQKPLAAITLAVDEMSGAYPVTALPMNLRGFYRLCTGGRHYRINLVGATQRPAQVNTEFRGNLDQRYFLRLTEPADLDAVEKTAGKEIRNKVASLPNYVFIHQKDGAFSADLTRK